MKDITQVLQELSVGDPSYGFRGVDVYVVIDDHTSSAEPQVHRQNFTAERAAHSTGEQLAGMALDDQVRAAIYKWRQKAEA